MPAFPCHVRYTFTVSQSDLKAWWPGGCTGEAEELREPDAWGDPGAVVSRRWIQVSAQNGRDVTDAVIRGHYRPGRLDPVGAVSWLVVDGWEAGA